MNTDPTTRVQYLPPPTIRSLLHLVCLDPFFVQSVRINVVPIFRVPLLIVTVFVPGVVRVVNGNVALLTQPTNVERSLVRRASKKVFRVAIDAQDAKLV